MSRKSNSAKSEKSTDKTAIYIALIGFAGTIILALVGIYNTRAQILLPVSLTQTAQVLLLSTATNTSSLVSSTQSMSTKTPTAVGNISSGWIVFEKWLHNPDQKNSKTTVELWAIQSDSSELRQLTQGYYDNDASWSPDGTVIAFRRNVAGTTLIDLSGNLQFIGGSYGLNPQWIDNQIIIFNDIFDNKWVLRLSTKQGQDRGVLDVPIVEPFAPMISPDGKLLATGGKDGLNLITLSNNSVTKLLNWEGSYPSAWSPDNQHLIFSDKNGDCWILDIFTLQKQPFPDVAECNISYSSDGTRAVYQYNDGIWIMNFDGTHKKPLILPSDDSHFYRAPVWQP